MSNILKLLSIFRGIRTASMMNGSAIGGDRPNFRHSMRGSTSRRFNRLVRIERQSGAAISITEGVQHQSSTMPIAHD